MTELPHTLLATRNDEDWELMVDDQRVRHTLQWATRRLGELNLMQDLGAHLEGDDVEPDVLRRIDELWEGVERRLTRRDLVSAFLTLATEPAELYRQALAEQMVRDMRSLSTRAGRKRLLEIPPSTMDNQPPAPLN